MVAHPVDVHVGKRLRVRRKMLGLSQEELGRSAGITFQQIQKYERGTNRVGSSRLYDFSRVLGVPVGYFFEGFAVEMQVSSVERGGAEPAAVEQPDTLESKETLKLVQAYYRIPDPAVRAKVLGLIKSLKNLSADGMDMLPDDE
jgi:transcriptional regulator with XRE-family HTH domain